MEGGSHSNPCSMMGFGDDDNNNVGDDGLCPMIITVPPQDHNHHSFFTTNTQYLALPPPPSGTGASSLTPHPAQTSGCFFMENDHRGAPPSSSCHSFSAVKAKIMAHPLYHRLLASYVNCQKVPANH